MVARETLASQIPGVLRDHGDRFVAQVVVEIERFLAQFAQRLSTLAREEADRHEQHIREALGQAERHDSDRARSQTEWTAVRKDVEALDLLTATPLTSAPCAARVARGSVRGQCPTPT